MILYVALSSEVILRRCLLVAVVLRQCAATQECHAADTGHDTPPVTLTHNIQTQDMTPHPVTLTHSIQTQDMTPHPVTLTHSIQTQDMTPHPVTLTHSIQTQGMTPHPVTLTHSIQTQDMTPHPVTLTHSIQTQDMTPHPVTLTHSIQTQGWLVLSTYVEHHTGLNNYHFHVLGLTQRRNPPLTFHTQT